MRPRQKNATLVVLALLCIAAGLAVVTPESAPAIGGAAPVLGGANPTASAAPEGAVGRRVVEVDPGEANPEDGEGGAGE